jgi:rubrerythrin
MEKDCKQFKNKSDYAEVKHGEWIKKVVEKHGIYRPTFICSKCGKRRFVLADYNYCPNCGARMDGEKK